MQFLKDRGFILRRINFGEADRIVTVFTKDNGKINIIAKGVRKITSRRGALLEPFNLINFQTVQSYSRKVLTEVELVNSFDSEKENLENYQKFFIVCELVDSLCPEALPQAAIYQSLFDYAHGVKNNDSLSNFKNDLLVNLGYWNNNRKFATEDDSYRYIESIIERKLKSRTIKF